MKTIPRLGLLVGLLLGLSACSLPFWPAQPAADEPATPAANVQPGQVAVINSDVIVTQPLSNDTISSPLTVEGRTKLTSGVIFLVIKDATEQIVATSSVAITDSGLSGSPYRGSITFSPPTSQNGWLEVYTMQSQAEGLRDVVRLPVIFNQFKSPTVKVFFHNSEGDPNFKDCSVVYPVEREVSVDNTADYSTQLVGAALTNLLAGPTKEDANNGFSSQLPTKDVKVQKVSFAKDPAGQGIVTVDFNQALQTGVAGSCRVIAIRSQITETLKQFPGVNQVVISIDGKTEDILQP